MVGEAIGPQPEQPRGAGKALGIGQGQAVEVAIGEIARHDHDQRRGVVGEGGELLRLGAEGPLVAVVKALMVSGGRAAIQPERSAVSSSTRGSSCQRMVPRKRVSAGSTS